MKKSDTDMESLSSEEEVQDIPDKDEDVSQLEKGFGRKRSRVQRSI